MFLIELNSLSSVAVFHSGLLNNQEVNMKILHDFEDDNCLEQIRLIIKAILLSQPSRENACLVMSGFGSRQNSHLEVTFYHE